ncbi:MAG: DUF5689 domain-containing protein, partial [Bacteroidota bacterium]
AIITSTGNVIIPEVKTLATITSADQSKLVSVAGVSFADSSTVFYTSKNYTISDVSGPSIFRTGFAEANYIGTAVPHSPRTLVALVGQYLTTMQITSRSLADIIAPPALSITPATLTGFEYIQNNGPSAGQSFAISGENLSPASGDLIVTGSTNYEVSSDNVTFGPTALIPYTGGSLTSVNAWVRLKAGLTAGNYNGEIVAVSGGTATTQNVTCSGTVLPPGPAIIVGTITGFGSQAINTTSAEKSYLVSGAYLLGNIVIVPPTGFEISLLSGESFVPSNPIVMIPSGGIVDPKLIYVRFKPTLVQPYAGDIIHTSIGATTQNVAVSGTGVWGEPTNHVTAFAAGTTTLTTIPLTWTDATGGTLPEAYLIKGSATSYSAIVDPLDGTPEVNSLLVQNVLQGVGNHAFTGLNSATTYYFKIYPYTNTGTAIDYKTSPVAPEASATTQSPPETTVKWDGGAGTDAWADASNWDNNIVPAATDHVLLDNSLVTGTYAVILPAGAVKTIIKKLTISPAISNTITLTLPVGNTYGVTGDAGFVVGDNTASTDDIIIHSGGTLINSSGAASGNGIQVNSISNGTCRINNGGKYVHNTSRSAGGIIPALSTVAGTENGTYEYDVPGTGSASITASGRTFGNLTLTRTAGAAKYTASGGSALTIRGNFHFNSGVKFFSTMTGAMNLSGNLTNNGDTVLISTTQTVNLNGSAGQIIEGTSDKTICGGLNINDAGGITLNAPRITVNGNLTFTAGLFTLGANDMRLGPLSAIAGTPAETSMIVATSAGQVKKEFATGFTGSFTFPVGNNTPAAEYSPVTLNFTSGTFGAANFAGVNLVNAKYPSDPNNLNYLRRYWNLTQSGITGFTCDATFQYLTGDVNGNEAKIFCVKVDLSPYVAY